MDYRYKAIITDVFDGDTITADIDLGFDVWIRGTKIRLYGIDAPEMKGASKEDGKISRDWLRSQVLESEEITIRTIKDKREKYGRMLGIIEKGDRILNDELIEAGLAKKVDW